MKLLPFFFTALLILCSFANAELETHKYKKIYIDQKDIQIAKNGIGVKLEDTFFLVKSLHSDNKGLYILETDSILIKKSKHKDVYYCPKCGKLMDCTGREARFHRMTCKG